MCDILLVIHRIEKEVHVTKIVLANSIHSSLTIGTLKRDMAKKDIATQIFDFQTEHIKVNSSLLLGSTIQLQAIGVLRY